MKIILKYFQIKLSWHNIRKVTRPSTVTHSYLQICFLLMFSNFILPKHTIFGRTILVRADFLIFFHLKVMCFNFTMEWYFLLNLGKNALVDISLSARYGPLPVVLPAFWRPVGPSSADLLHVSAFSHSCFQYSLFLMWRNSTVLWQNVAFISAVYFVFFIP